MSTNLHTEYFMNEKKREKKGVIFFLIRKKFNFPLFYLKEKKKALFEY